MRLYSFAVIMLFNMLSSDSLALSWGRKEEMSFMIRGWVDLPGIEPGTRQCECRVMPLYYKPDRRNITDGKSSLKAKVEGPLFSWGRLRAKMIGLMKAYLAASQKAFESRDECRSCSSPRRRSGRGVAGRVAVGQNKGRIVRHRDPVDHR